MSRTASSVRIGHYLWISLALAACSALAASLSDFPGDEIAALKMLLGFGQNEASWPPSLSSLFEWPVIAVLLAAGAITSFLAWFFTPLAAERRNQTSHSDPPEDAPEFFWQRGAFWFALVAILVGTLVTLYASTKQIDLVKEIGSNNFLAGVFLAVVGFLLLQRFQEYENGFHKLREKQFDIEKSLREIADRISAVQTSFDERHTKNLKEKIDGIYAKLEDFVEKNRWVQKVLDEDLANQAYPNLRAVSGDAARLVSEGKSKEAFQFFRTFFVDDRDDQKQRPPLPSATSTDIEITAFVAYYLIGDRELAFHIYNSYKHLRDPLYVAGYIRYALLVGQTSQAETWVASVEANKRLVQRVDILSKYVPLPRSWLLAAHLRRPYLTHWSILIALKAYYSAIGDDRHVTLEQTDSELQSRRDEMLFTIANVQLGLINKTDDKELLEWMRQRFRTREPLVIELYLFIALLSDSSEPWDDAEIEHLIERGVPRSELDLHLYATIRKMRVARAEGD